MHFNDWKLLIESRKIDKRALNFKAEAYNSNYQWWSKFKFFDNSFNIKGFETFKMFWVWVNENP